MCVSTCMRAWWGGDGFVALWQELKLRKSRGSFKSLINDFEKMHKVYSPTLQSDAEDCLSTTECTLMRERVCVHARVTMAK